MTDHAERRAGALEAVKLMRDAGWNKAADRVMDEVNELYPPPEPERVWVRLEKEVDVSRSPDGTWQWRYVSSKVTQPHDHFLTDDTVSVLASLVPGLVAKPVEPTAWLNVYADWNGARCNRHTTLASAKSGRGDDDGGRTIPIVELPEVPRDA